MKFLLIILLLISGTAFSQTTYYIRADSTKLQKIGGNNELILQNSTRTRTGAYLKNISNGITGFFYAIDSAWMETDSTLVVRRGDGNDTLLIRGSGISTTPGIDDVLAVGQNVAVDRTINLTGSGKTLTIEGNYTNGFAPQFLKYYSMIVDNNTALQARDYAHFTTGDTAIHWEKSITGGAPANHQEVGLFLNATGNADTSKQVALYSGGIPSQANKGSIGAGTTLSVQPAKLEMAIGTEYGDGGKWKMYNNQTTVDTADYDMLFWKRGDSTIRRMRSWQPFFSSGVASTVPISGLTNSAGTNGLTIGHAQTWTSSLTTATPLILTTSTLTSGNILNLTSTTVDINTGVGLNINFSGANANAGRTAKGLAVAVTNTGTTNTNTGATFDVSGAVVNTALFGTASGGTTSRGSWFTASGASSSNHAVLGAASGADARGFFASISGTGATTYGAYLDNQTAGTTAFGMFTSVTGANTTNIGVRITASGATTNNALDIAAGALTLNGSAGTSGQVLTSAGANTLPTWETPSAGGAAPGNFGNVIINRNNVDATPGSDSLDFDGGLVVKGSGTFSTLTSGSVVYAGTGGLLTTSSNLTYSGTAFTTIGNHTGNQTFFVKNTNADGRAAFQMGTDANDLNGFFFANGSTKTDYAGAGSINFMNILNAPLGFITNNTLRATITGPGNLMLGGFTDPASAVYAFGITNGVAPSGSITNGVVLYSEDVAASAELKVRDEAGNITVLSPHHFEGIPMGKSEDMAWSYYSERDGKYITVDMLKAIRTIEDLTRRVEKLEKELNMKSKKPVKLVYTGKVKAKKPVPINKQP